MAGRKVDVEFKFVDNFTQSFQKSIGVLTSGTKAAERAWKGVEKAGQGIESFGNSLTKSITVPAVALGTVAATKYAEVDQVMQLTNATMKNTEEQARLLNDAMSNAAMNSTLGMADAANAALNFARAGLSAEEAAAALAPAMNLATGEGGDLNTVSAGLVGTINGFSDTFENTAHYADVFAAACNNSALDVNSLSESFSVAAPVFATAGMNVEDAALYMGTMADNGIDANVAATSLKTGLARLVAPAKEGAEKMEALGICVTNADGSFKDSITIQKELHDAFAGLSESEQMAAASAIFGKSQMSSWLALINTSPESVQALDSSLRDCGGTTQAMADAMMGGFGGSIEKLKSSVDVLLVSFGSLVADYLTPVINKAQEMVDAFAAMSPEQKEQAVRWAALAAAAGPAISIFGRIITVVGNVGLRLTSLVRFVKSATAGFKAMSAGSSLLRAGIAALTSPVGLVAAGIAALITVVVSVKTHFDTFQAAVSGAGVNLSDLQVKFSGVITAGQGFLTALAPVADFLGTVLAGAAGVAVAGLLGFLSGAAHVFEGIITAATGVITFITGVFTGNWEQAWQGVCDIFKGIVETIGGFLEGITKALGSILGALGELFGFNGKTVNVTANITQSSGYSAAGTGTGRGGAAKGRARGDNNWTGGIVQVHEQGGEIIDLPHGTRIYPHDKSVQMARGEGMRVSIPKLADTIVVREQADIDRIADRIARKIQMAAGNMGGVSVADMA